jgi:hypothetical protein
MNFLKDLLSSDELKQYEETVYPFNLSILDSALKLKLKDDPGYEVWVPLVYYKLEPFLRKSADVEFKPYRYFISNKGRIGHTRKGPLRIISKQKSAGYWTVAIVVGRNKHDRFMVHRIMGCCFVPLKDLSNHHPKDLQINHIDGDKGNLDLGNLEWSTHSGNTLHAVSTGLAVRASGKTNSRTKPAKGKILRGTHAGYEFVLSGRKQQMDLGFLQSSINRCCLGITGEHKHCVWSFATEEEVKRLPNTLPEEILNNLFAMKPAPKRSPR